jgi:molecular chaperone GrpE
VSERKGNGGVAGEKPPDDESQAAPKAEETGLAAVDTPLTQEAFDALKHERDEAREQLLRRRADFENFKKRVERDRQQAGQDAVADVFQALIPVLDNLDRALETPGSESPLREGVLLIRRQIVALLEAHDIVARDPTGEPFDPETHEALSHEAAPGYADGTVVEVFQKAYFRGGRLLRPALVKVAKGETPAENQGARGRPLNVIAEEG